MEYIYDSPIGALLIVYDEDNLLGVHFDRAQSREFVDNALIQRVIGQMDEYFAGGRKDFDLPLSPAGTDFQKEVWAALAEIPYGQTRSYGDIAGAVGRPKAARAIGTANGKNPIVVVIPCHRVIGANGALAGYSGGVERKIWLLDLEKQANCVRQNKNDCVYVNAELGMAPITKNSRDSAIAGRHFRKGAKNWTKLRFLAKMVRLLARLLRGGLSS
jgi:methylated-DNA-[protein]-cysteine S-methyltransferase